MSNPVMERVMGQGGGAGAFIDGMPMTVQGTVNKLFLMFALLCTSFGVVFYQYMLGFMDKVLLMTTVGTVVGLVLALVICFTRKAMGVLVPLYAFAEGMVLGGVSAVFNAKYPGIVSQTVLLTFLALFVMLGLYKIGAIKATDKFRAVIMTATRSIFLFYLVTAVLAFFNISVPVLYASNIFGIGFSAIVCGIAALNLILDFDFIERGSMNMFPKEYEWYGAFGLMVTLVWLYIEILNLLAKLNRR